MTGPLTGTTVAVTGATGFLGSHIALQLRALGAEVRGVVRTPSKGKWLEDHGVHFAKADLMDPASLTGAFEGADVVVSNAALSTRKKASWDQYERANVTGTENVMNSIAAAGVERVVYVSTVGVYKVSPYRALDESTPKRERFRLLDPSNLTTNWKYALTKAMGEQRAWDIADREGLALTTLRPGPIYGPRDHKMTQIYVDLVSRRFLPLPTAGVPHVHAEDVAIAVANACHTEASAGKAYNVGGETHPLADVLRLVRDLRQSRCRILRIPTPFWVRFDDSAAKRDLGFSNRPIDRGMAEALQGRP